MERLRSLSGSDYWDAHREYEAEYKQAQHELKTMTHADGHVSEITLANSAREYWYATNLLLMLNSRFLEPTRGDRVYEFVDGLRRKREMVSPDEREYRVSTVVALHRIASRAAWALSSIVAECAEELTNFHLVYNPHIRTQSRYWAIENNRPNRPHRWYEKHKDDARGLTMAQADIWKQWADEHVSQPERVGFEEMPDAAGPGFFNGLWLLHQSVDRRAKRVMEPVIGTKPPYTGKVIWPGYTANRMANIRSLTASAALARRLADSHFAYQRALDDGTADSVPLYTFARDVPGTLSRLVPDEGSD